MEEKSQYLSELYVRATEIFAQMTKIAQHISDLLTQKKYSEIEFWGTVFDDLEAEVESIILIREALL
jgi:hypothetical protein